MQPGNEKVMRRKRERGKLFLERITACICLLFLLGTAAKGTASLIKIFSDLPPAVPAARQPTTTPPAVTSSSSAASALSSAPTSSALQAKSEKWFSDALFIGDSRTEGLRNYDGLKGATYYALKGLTVSTAYTRNEITQNGSKKTVMQAQAEHSFGKIYIMLGVNELGWSNTQAFFDDYTKMVEDLENSHPKAQIYLQAIITVSAKKSSESSVYKNDKITLYNQGLQKIAKNENVVYLDTAQALSQNGVLPDDASTDGVHLNTEYCAKWCSFLMTHIE